MATGLSGALQWAAAKAGVHAAGDIPSGPYGFIFACLVQYYFAVPPSSKMFLYGGWWLTDKVGQRRGRRQGHGGAYGGGALSHTPFAASFMRKHSNRVKRYAGTALRGLASQSSQLHSRQCTA